LKASPKSGETKAVLSAVPALHFTVRSVVSLDSARWVVHFEVIPTLTDFAPENAHIVRICNMIMKHRLETSTVATVAWEVLQILDLVTSRRCHGLMRSLWRDVMFDH
jgi:hypothetical protein